MPMAYRICPALFREYLRILHGILPILSMPHGSIVQSTRVVVLMKLNNMIEFGLRRLLRLRGSSGLGFALETSVPLLVSR